jgi:mannose-6-phosphate isomerase-like protein (cupin superfamily)
MSDLSPCAVRLRQRYPKASWVGCSIGIAGSARGEVVHPKEVPGQVLEHQWGIEANFTVPNLLTFKHVCVYKGQRLSEARGQEYGRLLVIDSGRAKLTIATDELEVAQGQTIVVPPTTPLSIEALTGQVELYEIHPRG